MEEASNTEEEEEDTVDEYLRFRQADGSWVLEVGRVEWPHPHEPCLIWTPFRTWTREPRAEQVLAARTAAIEQYFRTCVHCHELCHIGHMHDQQICQGCAEGVLGIVH